jgi:hypothetical protein
LEQEAHGLPDLLDERVAGTTVRVDPPAGGDYRGHTWLREQRRKSPNWAPSDYESQTKAQEYVAPFVWGARPVRLREASRVTSA